MKKIILLLGLLLFLAQTSFAQLEVKPGAGINITDVSKDPESGESSGKVGWQIGATVLSGDKFYWEAGAFYTQKTTEFTFESSVGQDDIDGTFSGVYIPVRIGYHLLGSEETLASLRGFGGGSLFILTDVDLVGFDKDDFTNPTGGVHLGAGVDIAIFYLDLSWEWSVSDVSDLDELDIGKRRSFFLTAGLRF
ncbi:outer membrane beta-barrel protein [Mangrovivirga cuniculi]|uniref:Outer membrane protein beta-barrel domain-containing protein n=1 Tax=Mangrovivirga cuniculi TaxID=2715131 RepID=A0A4D7JL28_9BACT|nr:outer membrane beta-barrel protein [Mangrovivirga cuniculi]QCK16579.1 hypothetical protein DCC35_18525 [Mangrovivirga cuniculi]